MLVLFETPAGYALFRVLQGGDLQEVDLAKAFSTADEAQKFVKLQAFSKFGDTAEALEAAVAVCESTMTKRLKKFLSKSIVNEDMKEPLAVADAKLGGIIKKKLGIDCVFNTAVLELFRGLRTQLESLLAGLPAAELQTMTLGLAHQLSRHKLQFSPDKVDTMIIQAIGLLDDLEKELNTYAMRVKEWYGWHFPEMAAIIGDNIAYAKVVRKMGLRTNCVKTDLSDMIDEATEKTLKQAAEISMGTEISEADVGHIKALCDQAILIHEYRTSLNEYLRTRMQAVAPNLTCVVGELVGARLLAHAGSLMNLAKHPASTIQILGAEKALFRALKTKHETPKYGLIYHASLVGQSSAKYKPKISRAVGAKAALCVRVDALGDTVGVTIGERARQSLEKRLQGLESGQVSAMSAPGKKAQAEKLTTKATTAYNAASDVAVTQPAKKSRTE